MKNESFTEFEKEDFLARVMHSVGLTTGLPRPKRGCRIEKTRSGLSFLSLSETSLLQIRDRLLSKNHADAVLGQAQLICYLDSIVMRFYWVLEPNYKEISRWSNPEHLALINEALSRWQDVNGLPSYLRRWRSSSSESNDWTKVASAAHMVMAELLAQLDKETYEEKLASN